MKAIKYIAIFVILLVVSYCFSLTFNYGFFGTSDFIEYWAAFRVFLVGGNPYNPQVLLPVQQGVGYANTQPLMMWNGPWLLVLLYPILSFDFSEAARVWCLVNLFFIFGIGGFAWSVLKEKYRSSLGICLLAALLFSPHSNTLYLGQVSLLLAFAVSGLFWALCRNRLGFAGGFLCLLTVKPHLIYLVALVVTWWIIRERKFTLIGYFFLYFTILLIATYSISPLALHYWIQSQIHPPEGVTTTLHWFGATLVGIVRALSRELKGAQLGPMVLIPGITGIVTLFWLIRKPRSWKLEWERYFPLFLILSLLTAPFGWFFDHSLLALVQVIIIAKVLAEPRTNKLRWLILLSLMALQITSYLQARHFAEFQHELFWFPCVLLLIALTKHREQKPENRT